MAISSFKRIEKKYVIDEQQKKALLAVLKEHMDLDFYCLNEETYKVQNIYYDTSSKELISKSIRKPSFKQKLRARKYTGQNHCFLEIKKKVDGVVGKRRVALSMEELEKFIDKRIKPLRTDYVDKIVIEEIDYLLSLYQVFPNVLISYERLGFFDKDSPEFRITFDNQIRFKKDNFLWDAEDFDGSLLNDDLYIMEIKSNVNYPLWLVRELSRQKIYPRSFSKYGTQYIQELKNNVEGVEI